MIAPHRAPVPCAGRCGTAVRRFTCARCWWRLPRAYRRRIVVAAGNNLAGPHVQALQEARDWFRRARYEGKTA